MLKKLRSKIEVRKIVKRIEELEKKRYRSQSALVEAILKHEIPDDEDVEYFNNYTAEIDRLRREIRAINKTLEEGK